MSQTEIKLCDPGCQLWHSKQFVMNQLGIGQSTLYRWINDGLRISRKGMIKCSWIRECKDRLDYRDGVGCSK